MQVNSYNIHDVSEWRDLNLKLVIQVWRDIKLLPEKVGLHWVTKKELENQSLWQKLNSFTFIILKVCLISL